MEGFLETLEEIGDVKLEIMNGTIDVQAECMSGLVVVRLVCKIAKYLGISMEDVNVCVDDGMVSIFALYPDDDEVVEIKTTGTGGFVNLSNMNITIVDSEGNEIL